MKKDYTAEIESLHEKTNELRKNIINAIKDYMNEHGITRFVNWFFEEDDRIKDENMDEYKDLYLKTDAGRYIPIDYWHEAQIPPPHSLSLNKNGELLMECSVYDEEIGYLINETRTLGEFEINFTQFPIYLLNQCLLNLQNEKFHRMNELINND